MDQVSQFPLAKIQNHNTSLVKATFGHWSKWETESMTGFTISAGIPSSNKIWNFVKFSSPPPNNHELFPSETWELFDLFPEPLILLGKYSKF